jgi:hypothetical protein
MRHEPKKTNMTNKLKTEIKNKNERKRLLLMRALLDCLPKRYLRKKFKFGFNQDEYTIEKAIAEALK